MAARRKYPAWPGPTEKEVPYDTEHFKMWCVNLQDMTISTAKAYISSIRTAFSVMFAGDDATFTNLKNAFISRNHNDPEKRITSLEAQYERLEAYILAVCETEDFTLDEFNHNLPMGVERKAPIKHWVTALQTYLRFIRWRIDRERRRFGMEIAKPVNSPEYFLNVPMTQFFRQYLKESGYKAQSVDSHVSNLKRLYNLFLRQILKEDIIEDFSWTLKRKNIVKIFSKFSLKD